MREVLGTGQGQQLQASLAEYRRGSQVGLAGWQWQQPTAEREPAFRRTLQNSASATTTRKTAVADKIVSAECGSCK
jgi:hypothetical protein